MAYNASVDISSIVNQDKETQKPESVNLTNEMSTVDNKFIIDLFQSSIFSNESASLYFNEDVTKHVKFLFNEIILKSDLHKLDVPHTKLLSAMIIYLSLYKSDDISKIPSFDWFVREHCR